MNQGAWYAIQHHLRRAMTRDGPGLPLQYAGRTAFAAPAVGYASVHIQQQQKLVQSALVGETSDDEDSGK
jgi:2-oxoglutarate dehydrogenase E1 component